MARRRNVNLKKVTLNLDKNDYDRAQVIFAHCGAAVGIRELVHQFVTAADAKRARASEPLIRELDIELPEE